MHTNMYIYVYMYTCRRTGIDICVCMYKKQILDTHMYVCRLVYMYVHTDNTCMHAKYMCMYICRYVYMYVGRHA